MLKKKCPDCGSPCDYYLNRCSRCETDRRNRDQAKKEADRRHEDLKKQSARQHDDRMRLERAKLRNQPTVDDEEEDEDDFEEAREERPTSRRSSSGESLRDLMTGPGAGLPPYEPQESALLGVKRAVAVLFKVVLMLVIITATAEGLRSCGVISRGVLPWDNRPTAPIVTSVPAAIPSAPTSPPPANAPTATRSPRQANACSTGCRRSEAVCLSECHGFSGAEHAECVRPCAERSRECQRACGSRLRPRSPGGFF